jgi:hypothetical protein
MVGHGLARVLDEVDEHLEHAVAVEPQRRALGQLPVDLERLALEAGLLGDAQRAFQLALEVDFLAQSAAAGVGLVAGDELADVVEPLPEGVDLVQHLRVLEAHQGRELAEVRPEVSGRADRA